MMDLKADVVLLIASRLLYKLRWRRVSLPADYGWMCRDGRCCKLNCVVLPSLWAGSICYDAGRRRVSSYKTIPRFMLCHRDPEDLFGYRVDSKTLKLIEQRRLHPAKYPWEHTKYLKTFDHQA